MSLQNYIKTEDLNKYTPLIMQKMLYNTQTDFQPQIDLAGEFVLVDLQSSGIDTRLVGVRNDLQTAYNTSNYNIPLTHTTTTGTVTGSQQYGFESYKRFVVDVTNYNQSGSVIFTLQGANVSDINAIGESDWTDIVTQSFDSTMTADDVIKIHTQTFEDVSRYVRYKVVASSGAEITYGVYTAETGLDNLIILKSLILVMIDNQEGSATDQWKLQKEDYQKMYQTMLNGSRFLVDISDDGKPQYYDSQRVGGSLSFDQPTGRYGSPNKLRF